MVDMKKLGAVIKREYLEKVRTKWFIITTALGPVFFIGISVLPALLSVKSMSTAEITNFRIIDATGVELGPRVAKSLRDRVARDPVRKAMSDSAAAKPMRETEVVPVQLSALAEAESTATKAVIAGQVRGYLVLDSGTIASGKSRYAGRNTTSLGEMGQIESAIRSALVGRRLEGAGISSSRADSLMRVTSAMTAERLSDRGRGGSGIAGFFFGFLIAMLLYMMIMLYGQNVLRGVLEEKTTRVAEVVISSISPETLLAGKVIGIGAVGLTQQLVWLTFAGIAMSFGLGALAASGITLPSVSIGQLVILLLYFLLGYAFYASLFAAVGAMCSSQEEANQAAQPVIIMLVASIIFMQPVLMAPTGTLATVMTILPFGSPVLMPMLMSATPVPAWHLAASLGSLVVACIAAIWVSARIYRVGLLMTGKRPSLKELVRWVKYA